MSYSTGGGSMTGSPDGGGFWSDAGDFFGGFLRENPISIGGGKTQVTLGGESGLSVGENNGPAESVEDAVRPYLDAITERLRQVGRGALEGAANVINPTPTYINMAMLVLAMILIILAFRARR